MEEIELKINDKVELWNGIVGEVTGLDFPAITIQNKESYPQEFHKMNLKTINNTFIDARNVFF